jgi:hypothetical protein
MSSRPPLVTEPIVEEYKCSSDAQCPSKEACFDDGCSNPCLRIQPCPEHAECTVKDELPKRVMVCKCKPGYVDGGDHRQCELIRKMPFVIVSSIRKSSFTFFSFFLAEPIEVGCKGDSDCQQNQACRNRGCIDPCAEAICAPSAFCTVKNRRATCDCPPGTTGDPYSRCNPGS